MSFTLLLALKHTSVLHYKHNTFPTRRSQWAAHTYIVVSHIHHACSDENYKNRSKWILRQVCMYSIAYIRMHPKIGSCHSWFHEHFTFCHISINVSCFVLYTQRNEYEPCELSEYERFRYLILYAMNGFHYLPICTAHTNKIYKNGCTSLLATNSYFSVEINVSLSQKQRFYFVFFQFRYEKVWVIRKLYGRPKTVDPSHTHVTPWLSMCVRAVHGNVVSLYMCIFVCVFFVLFSFLLSLFRSRSLRLHIHNEKKCISLCADKHTRFIRFQSYSCN